VSFDPVMDTVSEEIMAFSLIEAPLIVSTRLPDPPNTVCWLPEVTNRLGGVTGVVVTGVDDPAPLLDVESPVDELTDVEPPDDELTEVEPPVDALTEVEPPVDVLPVDAPTVDELDAPETVRGWFCSWNHDALPGVELSTKIVSLLEIL